MSVRQMLHPPRMIYWGYVIDIMTLKARALSNVLLMDITLGEYEIISYDTYNEELIENNIILFKHDGGLWFIESSTQVRNMYTLSELVKTGIPLYHALILDEL